MYSVKQHENVFMSPKLEKTVKRQGDYYLDMRTKADNKSRFRAFSPPTEKKEVIVKPPPVENVKKVNKSLRERELPLNA